MFGKAVPSNLQQLEQVKEWECKICRCFRWPDFLDSCISQGEKSWIFLVGITLLYYNIQKIDLHVQFSAWMNLNICARLCMNIIDFLFSVDHILFLTHCCIFSDSTTMYLFISSSFLFSITLQSFFPISYSVTIYVSISFCFLLSIL